METVGVRSPEEVIGGKRDGNEWAIKAGAHGLHPIAVEIFDE